ncbi:MAG TPA: S-4TM family putative pore-forming effector [Clostridium sp.]|uniref:S-4TM family putative pore-forming effector n=1 Tax=Clostridium sp. TaxID=1506 RepID=UPI002F948C1C
MNNINQKQNKEKILKYLFAQRTLYKKCKKLFGITLVISIFVYLIGVIPHFSKSFSMASLIFSSVCVIAYLFIEIKNQSIKKNAVDFQEYIDRTLFEFKINKKIIPNLNKLDNKSNEIILSNYKKYQQSIDPNYKYTVYNWYSNTSSLPIDIARVVCQNENIRWENRQRELYTIILGGVIILLVLLTGAKVYRYNEPAINLLYAIPVAIEFIKIIIFNIKAIKAIGEAEEIITGLYINIEMKGNRYNKRKIAEQSLIVQEKIREYRLNNISIPEFLYKKMKLKEQQKSTDFISLKITEILNNI